MRRYHIVVIGRDDDALADLVRRHRVDVARHTVEQLERGGYRIHCHASSAQIRALLTAGYVVERREDVDRVGKARQVEVGPFPKTRKAASSRAVFGATRYLSVAEVEACLTGVADPRNDSFVSLITLPNTTWENRTCHALRIGRAAGGMSRPGIYLLGGVHGREWGSSDILINFAQRLSEAYRTHTGIRLGGQNFTAAQVRTLVDTKDVYVFPQANPDGRHFSMTRSPMWRKNRRPAPPGSSPDCVGVDLNRNYDFLWDFVKYFDAAAPIVNAIDPCDHDNYVGPEATSEPETKNVVWMFDENPNIRSFIDLHSYAEGIFYPWGDDDNQSTTPSMNFGNPAFDGKRGIPNDDAYLEYLAEDDRAAIVSLANTMREAIQKVRGRVYSVEPSMSLFPTAGTSNDYAYARHLVDPGKAKVYAYTVKWGSPDNPTPFHPPYGEMREIIAEMTAALLAFCIAM